MLLLVRLIVDTWTTTAETLDDYFVRSEFNLPVFARICLCEMLLLLLVIVNTWTTETETLDDHTIISSDFNLPWSPSNTTANSKFRSIIFDLSITIGDFHRNSSGLYTTCFVSLKKLPFEHSELRIDIESPNNASDPTAQTVAETNTSLTKTILIRLPDNSCLGTYICRLFDENEFVGGNKRDLTELPSEFEETTSQTVQTTTPSLLSRATPRFNWWLIIFLCTLVVLVVAMTAYVIMKIRSSTDSPSEWTVRSSNFVVRETNNAYLHEELQNLPYDTRFEVDEQNLERLECMGGGHFGTVFNGKFNVSRQWTSNSPFRHYLTSLNLLSVAIKVPGDEDGLRDIATCQNILHDELKILCAVGSHPNIATLVGAITKPNNMCIIVEKCSNGSLLNFLKSRKESFIPRFQNETKPSNLLSKGLSTAHLLSFSMQIALGMDHLSLKKCLHRDLATRNVLVTDKLICKIADFGLSKRINRKDYYRVATNYDLPVRWMSPEAITNLTFTVESDIWSYGIVLYEIFTLGGCPYPSVSNSDVMEAIRNGTVNDQPEFCPTEIYSHMLSCWNVDPGQIPLFSKSAEFFKKHLFVESQQVLYTVEKELSRERHRQSKLEYLRSRSHQCLKV